MAMFLTSAPVTTDELRKQLARSTGTFGFEEKCDSDVLGIYFGNWDLAQTGTGTSATTPVEFGRIMLDTGAAAASTASMVTNFVFPANSGAQSTIGSTKAFKKFVMEWGAYFDNSNGIDETAFFMGTQYAVGSASTRATQDIYGFGISGGVLQAVVDNGGVEVTSAMTGLTLSDTNIFRIEVLSSTIQFYVNNVLRYTASKLAAPSCLIFFIKNSGAASSKIYLTDIKAYLEPTEV